MDFSNEAINNVFKFLDSLDLTNYLKEFKKRTVQELMDKLEKDYPYSDEYSETLFDSVNEIEFVEYLNIKYNLKIKEKLISYYYINF